MAVNLERKDMWHRVESPSIEENIRNGNIGDLIDELLKFHLSVPVECRDKAQISAEAYGDEDGENCHVEFALGYWQKETDQEYNDRVAYETEQQRLNLERMRIFEAARTEANRTLDATTPAMYMYRTIV